MRHFAVLALLLVGTALAASRSQAQTGPIPPAINGFCFMPPYNTLTSCSTPGPLNFAPPTPTKLLEVGAGMAAPAGTTSYDVRVTSRAACFPLNEPIYLYTMGKPGVAALTQYSPFYVPSRGAPVPVVVEQNPTSPQNGQAGLTLEVYNAQVGPAGLNLKAVWPHEGVERVVQVIAPASPTPGTPGTATNTPVPTTGPTATTLPTGSPGPTATATAFPTPGPGQMFAQACVDPLILSGATEGGEQATLYGRTVPGATCFPSISYSTGGTPVDPLYLQEAIQGEVADANGLVAFPFSELSTGDYGIASVTCSYGGQTVTGFTYFFISQTVPPGPQPGGTCPPGPGSGVQASANVVQFNPPRGSSETVVACLFSGAAAAAGAPMVAVFHFAEGTQVCTSQTDTTGTASCTIGIGQARAGFPVVVEVYFLYGGQLYVAVTAFTPV